MLATLAQLYNAAAADTASFAMSKAALAPPMGAAQEPIYTKTYVLGNQLCAPTDSTQASAQCVMRTSAAMYSGGYSSGSSSFTNSSNRCTNNNREVATGSDNSKTGKVEQQHMQWRYVACYRCWPLLQHAAIS
jgi:hypothetical protein